MLKRILIAGMLALAVASSALAATGTKSPSGRDDRATRREKVVAPGHKARHAKRSHRRHEVEHVRRHDDGAARGTATGSGSREAEPGDDRGGTVEPGDDRGGTAEPGDDNGGGRHGGGDDGSGHR